MLISRQVTLHEEELDLETQVNNNFLGTAKRSYTQTGTHTRTVSRENRVSSRLERLSEGPENYANPVLRTISDHSGLANSHTSVCPSS